MRALADLVGSIAGYVLAVHFFQWVVVVPFVLGCLLFVGYLCVVATWGLP